TPVGLRSMAGGGKRSSKAAKKKGPTKGSGGHGKRALQGRGATPPAHMRHWYKERQRRAEAAAAANAAKPARQPRVKRDDAPETGAGRNPGGEALPATVPANPPHRAQP